MSQDQQLNNDELLSVLEWYRAAGVDLAVGEDAIDRFAQKTQQAAAPRAAVQSMQQASQPAAPPPLAGPIGGDPGEAQRLAAEAPTLEALKTTLESYDGCGLKFRATQLVFGEGNPEAKIVIIGDPPGADEDREGRPFAGRTADLLTRMLASIGLDWDSVYALNTIPWRPPGNRAPTPEELSLCLPFLHRHVELIGPRLVMTMGQMATQTVFQSTSSIIKMRGKWQDVSIGSHCVPAIATLPPGYLLRNPAAKQQAWRDLLSFRSRMAELSLP
ncbi:uracil-DNA glycosylase [Devosia sp. MC532]|uniref:uracil-DNA glycosylase n=1 Tax=Devosia sp. MC532 TaxID=2799788 RepID=UPI0018F4200C|nr:uracil-DNA glycosylase [Devosia sp. MC532]MBJ7577589.1 uracil-DNA glycosylase [Devosia sp. MC532]